MNIYRLRTAHTLTHTDTISEAIDRTGFETVSESSAEEWQCAPSHFVNEFAILYAHRTCTNMQVHAMQVALHTMHNGNLTSHLLSHQHGLYKLTSCIGIIMRFQWLAFCCSLCSVCFGFIQHTLTRTHSLALVVLSALPYSQLNVSICLWCHFNGTPVSNKIKKTIHWPMQMAVCVCELWVCVRIIWMLSYNFHCCSAIYNFWLSLLAVTASIAAKMLTTNLLLTVFTVELRDFESSSVFVLWFFRQHHQ